MANVLEIIKILLSKPTLVKIKKDEFLSTSLPSTTSKIHHSPPTTSTVPTTSTIRRVRFSKTGVHFQ